MRYVVKYQIATYSGEIEINADEGDDRDTLIAIAERKLTRIGGTLPIGHRSYRFERKEAA